MGGNEDHVHAFAWVRELDLRECPDHIDCSRSRSRCAKSDRVTIIRELNLASARNRDIKVD